MNIFISLMCFYTESLRMNCDSPGLWTRLQAQRLPPSRSTRCCSVLEVKRARWKVTVFPSPRVTEARRTSRFMFSPATSRKLWVFYFSWQTAASNTFYSTKTLLLMQPMKYLIKWLFWADTNIILYLNWLTNRHWHTQPTACKVFDHFIIFHIFGLQTMAVLERVRDVWVVMLQWFTYIIIV